MFKHKLLNDTFYLKHVTPSGNIAFNTQKSVYVITEAHFCRL